MDIKLKKLVTDNYGQVMDIMREVNKTRDIALNSDIANAVYDLMRSKELNRKSNNSVSSNRESFLDKDGGITSYGKKKRTTLGCDIREITMLSDDILVISNKKSTVRGDIWTKTFYKIIVK